MKQTTSFVVRFTQNIFQNDKDETDIQWRGKISHVQGDDHLSFVKFQDAIQFMQHKLNDVTRKVTEDKTVEEQEGLLVKSFELWKKVALSGPKLMMEAIKDPKKQVAHLQDQISQVRDELSQRVELDTWRSASKSDFKKIVGLIQDLSTKVETLDKKVDKISLKS